MLLAEEEINKEKPELSQAFKQILMKKAVESCVMFCTDILYLFDSDKIKELILQDDHEQLHIYFFRNSVEWGFNEGFIEFENKKYREKIIIQNVVGKLRMYERGGAV